MLNEQQHTFMHNSAFDVLGLSSISLGRSNSLIFSICSVNSTHLVGDINKSESDDEASDKDLLSWKAIASIGIASGTSFLLGYDEGIMSDAVSTIQATLQLTDIQTNVMMGSPNFMAAFGTLLSSHVAVKYGRAIGLCWTAIQLLIGPLLIATANSYTQLMIGRVVTGFGCGFALTVAPLYAAVLALKQLRGSLIAMAEQCINFGVFVGYALAYFLAHLPDRYDWRVMVGVAIIIPLGTLLMLPFVPETPRWLKMKAARAQNERNGLNASRTSGSTDVQILDFYHDVEKDCGSNHSTAIDGLAIGSWRDVLHPKVETRRRLAAGMGIAIFQQICGSEAVVYYTPNILVSAGLGETKQDNKVLLMTMVIGFTKSVSASLSVYTVERMGRRIGAIGSCLGTALCLLAMSLAEQSNWFIAAVVLLCVFMVFFELGLGPLPTVLGSEIYPTTFRARALSLGMFVNRIISGCTTGGFPVLLNLFGATGTFLVFGFIGISGVLYCCVYSRD